MTRQRTIDRNLMLGLMMILLIAAIVAATIAQYRGAFTSTVDVTVDADRAGLTLAAGTPVKLYGVEVGAVGDIDTDGDRVSVELKLDPDEIENVPSDVSAQIVPPTAFGAKYVQLSADAASSAPAIEAGAVIPGTRVTVEVNEAFVNLTRVLDAARPAEVNSALTAVADAVDQRGEVIGRLISQTDAYLTSFNPSLQTLSDDLRVVDDVADIYDVVRPDLVDTIDDAGATSETVVAQQASLRALTLSLTSFSDSTDVLLRTSQAGLETSLKLLDPVTEVLARYSPELPCLVTGLAASNKLAESAVGGMNPGVTTYTRIVPGREAYQTPDELAVLGEDRGPACYGLPYVTPAESDLSYVDFETGTNPYSQPAPSLAPTDLLTSQLARVLGQGGARP